jgi:hypothetical protein
MSLQFYVWMHWDFLYLHADETAGGLPENGGWYFIQNTEKIVPFKITDLFNIRVVSLHLISSHRESLKTIKIIFGAEVIWMLFWQVLR